MDLFTPIKENRDFRRIYTRGKPYVSPVVVTYILKNRSQNVRVGITTGGKRPATPSSATGPDGSSGRRFVRATPQIREGFDFILVARPHALCKKYGYLPRINAAIERRGCFEMKRLLILLIRFYQQEISPFKQPCCKYYPTCSNYAL